MHVVAERPQARGDRIDELLMIAARQIAAPDGTCEQDVTDERDLRIVMEEHDMAGRVSRTMAHAERRLADRHFVAVLEPPAGCAVLRVGKAGATGISA